MGDALANVRSLKISRTCWRVLPLTMSSLDGFLISTLSFQSIENDLSFNFRCRNSQLANSRKIPIFTPPAPRPSVWFPDYEVMPVSVLLGTTSHVRYRINVHLRIFISIVPKMHFQCFQLCQEIS